MSMFHLNSFSSKWLHTPSVSVRGYIYNTHEELLTGEQLAQFFSVHNEEEWIERLQQSNGLFSVICHTPTFSAAAIDTSRIYPVYYRKAADSFLLSDNAYTLVQHGDKIDEQAMEEYKASGAPFEGKTLVEQIRQVKPGHYLLADGTQKPYYQYAIRMQDVCMHTYQELQTLLERVFQRMLQRINGRQIVVPLSGGNDSRLIVCMLKKAGYKNVLCYTAGRPNNKEEMVACKVAEQTGYQWIRINTLDPDLRKLISTDNEEFQRYYKHIGNLGNFVWLFDYVALRYLQQKGLLSDNAVFVPGHVADVVAGSHLTKACVHANDNVAYLTSCILYDSFEYFAKTQQSVRKAVKQYLLRHTHTDSAKWSVFQSFIFQNRLPHNILNSGRVYEFTGYDIELPFWDKEFIDFFRTQPYHTLNGCSFYIDCIRTCYFQPMGVDFHTPPHSASYYYRMKIRKRLKQLLPARMVHHFAHLEDVLGERELSEPLLRELISNGIYPDDKHYLSINQIMKDWYLMKVRQYLTRV